MDIEMSEVVRRWVNPSQQAFFPPPILCSFPHQKSYRFKGRQGRRASLPLCTPGPGDLKLPRPLCIALWEVSGRTWGGPRGLDPALPVSSWNPLPSEACCVPVLAPSISCLKRTSRISVLSRPVSLVSHHCSAFGIFPVSTVIKGPSVTSLDKIFLSSGLFPGRGAI